MLAALTVFDASQLWGTRPTIGPLTWPALSRFVVVCFDLLGFAFGLKE